LNFDPMSDDHADDDHVRLAALRAMLDDGISELDAGLGVETTPLRDRPSDSAGRAADQSHLASKVRHGPPLS
jgi:hypothetical protein